MISLYTTKGWPKSEITIVGSDYYEKIYMNFTSKNMPSITGVNII